MTSILSRPTRGTRPNSKNSSGAGGVWAPKWWPDVGCFQKWTHQGLRWLRIGPKSKVIVNAEYVFFILGPKGPKYSNLVQKPKFWTKNHENHPKNHQKIPLSIPFKGAPIVLCSYWPRPAPLYMLPMDFTREAQLRFASMEVHAFPIPTGGYTKTSCGDISEEFGSICDLWGPGVV